MSQILKVTLICLIASTLLSGCQTYRTRGQKLEEKTISSLQEQKITKEQVIEMIGQPTLRPSYSPKTWYYVYYVEQKRAWFTPKAADQQIVKLSFRDDETLQNVEVIASTQDNTIIPLDGSTPTYGTQKSALQKFVTNFGRFNALSKRESKR